jgi:hypothetical protein
LFKKGAEFGDALVDDLTRGSLEAGPPGTESVAARFKHLLQPAPEAAARLRQSLRAHGAFLPTEVWPHLEVLQAWKAGACAHYIPMLRERAPGCAVRPMATSSSEAQLMVPLSDEWDGGIPALRATVLEFLPEDAGPTPDAFLDALELEEGRGYCVALTNRRGLYRYLMDDVFFVEGRHGNMPILRFSHRKGVTSSLTGEKLTEAHVQGALEATGDALAGVVDFQLVPEWGEPPRYVLLLELSGTLGLDRLQNALRAFEEGLVRANVEYAAKRSSGRLGAPEMIVLESGEFERMRRAASVGRSDAQVKIVHLKKDLLDRSTLRIVRGVEWLG